MRVLVVGCGYVGWPLALELARRGHTTFGLRRSPDKLIAPPATPNLVTLLAADITQPASLETLPRNFDWVVNCVASGGGDATDYRRLYLGGMRNLIHWLDPQPRQPPRILYTSSTGVYGQNDGSEVDEASVTAPTTATAKILLETEQALLSAASAKHFAAVVLRVAGIYGPERGYLLKQFLQNEARIESDGGRTLNMIHRTDLIHTIITALETARAGTIYNVVDDAPVSQLEFFRWLSCQLHRPLPPTMPGTTAGRKRGLTNKRVANRKLKTELGVKLIYPSYREGYADLIKRAKTSTA